MQKFILFLLVLTISCQSSLKMIQSERMSLRRQKFHKIQSVFPQTKKVASKQTILRRQQSQDIVRICANSLFNSLPPLYCWKKGGDAGIIPSNCPEGFERRAALCFKKCNAGYKHIAGLCYKNCPEGFKDHGLTCYKHFFKWHFKKSYIPKSLTNFHKDVTCPGRMYHGGALCYRNCEVVGLVNCGIGACSIDKSTCGKAIMNLILNVVKGVVKLITFVLSLGMGKVDFSIKDLLNINLEKLGRSHLKVTYNMVLKVMDRGEKHIYYKVYERANKKFKKK